MFTKGSTRKELAATDQKGARGGKGKEKGKGKSKVKGDAAPANNDEDKLDMKAFASRCTTAIVEAEVVLGFPQRMLYEGPVPFFPITQKR